MTSEAKIPERHRLELSFVRARWLAAAAIAVLAALGAFTAVETGVVLATLVAGNVAIWRLAARVSTLDAQRRLGVAAVGLDAALVFGMGLVADSDSAAN